MDDGRLTDGHGRTVDFTNAVVIMTSNVGSQSLESVDTREREQVEGRIMEALRQRFRPEFLNRVDEILIFNALSKEDIRIIVGIQFSLLKKRLEDRKIELELGDRSGLKPGDLRTVSRGCRSRGAASPARYRSRVSAALKGAAGLSNEAWELSRISPSRE